MCASSSSPIVVDELIRGCVLCLFATSFRRAVFTATILFVCAKIDVPGGCQGGMVQILAQWRHQVASNVAMDMLHQAMCTVLHSQTFMAIEMASGDGVFLSSLMLCMRINLT